MIKKWKKLSEENYNAGFRKMIRRNYQLPDGRQESYDIKDEGKSVCVLALTKNKKIILAKQYRPGPDKIMLELPGGGVESFETTDEAIARELLEETGCEGKIKFIGTQWNCAYSNRETYNFVAEDCEKIREPENDKNEFIEIVEISIEEFKKHVRDGELTDAKTAYAAMEYLGL